MTLIETGRRIAEATGKLIEAFDKPIIYGYYDIARYFYGEALKKWCISPAPYKVPFYPFRIPETPPSQIQGELFFAFKRLLPPTDRAYQVAGISYYVSTAERVRGGESIIAGLMDYSRREEGYGLGILQKFNQPVIVLLPPLFNSQQTEPLEAIQAKDIWRGLHRDSNPQRRFRWVLIEEQGHWETVV